MPMLSQCTTVDGRTWLPGVGPSPALAMMVFPAPFQSEMRLRAPFTDKAWEELYGMCGEAEVDLLQVYRTYAVKFLPADSKKLKAAELKICAEALKEEIEAVKPSAIALFGPDLVKVFFGTGAKIGQFDGAVARTENWPGIDFLCLCQPSYVRRYPESRPTYVESLRKFMALASGRLPALPVDYTVVETPEHMRSVAEQLSCGGILSLDCEWEGDYPDYPGAFIRTVQFRMRPRDPSVPEQTYVLKLANQSTEFRDVEECSDQIAIKSPTMLPAEEKECLELLKGLLEDPGTDVMGHNVHEDGKWLLMLHGIDIRKNTFYDTMLAEHCINSMGPFGLEVLACKYTALGRYDTALEQRKLASPRDFCHGYAAMPDSILLPYGALDVVGPLAIMDMQVPRLERYLEPRGEYPCQLAVDLQVSILLYELEMTGMLVDPDQLRKLTGIYHAKRNGMIGPLQDMARERFGMEQFNPNSYKQMSALLFEKMRLAPIKTTGTSAKAWDWVQRQSVAVQAKYAPSTDGDTLEILAANGDPLLKALLDHGKVYTICKNFLRDDRTGGIPGAMHPDGRLHARFSQLSETARFKHSNPNVANFPKAAEGDLGKILGNDADGKPVAGVRSVIVADPGHVFIEGDFKQAELVTLGTLAGDETYISLLGTPGKDLHDRMMIDAFRLQVYQYDGSEYNMDEMAEIAAKDMALYEWLMKQLVYVKPDGERLTRADVKQSLRVAAKAVGFGICYGRGARALQVQVRAEVGINFPVDLFQQGIDTWHDTYKRASAFLELHGNRGVERGYVQNPFGRRRVFAPPSSEEEAAATRREAGNAVIQSTVADALLLSMLELERARGGAGLSFRIVNPIHDALMLLAPEKEADETAALLRKCMSSVEVPSMDGSQPFHLDVDLSVFRRWGAKE